MNTFFQTIKESKHVSSHKTYPNISGCLNALMAAVLAAMSHVPGPACSSCTLKIFAIHRL